MYRLLIVWLPYDELMGRYFELSVSVMQVYNSKLCKYNKFGSVQENTSKEYKRKFYIEILTFPWKSYPLWQLSVSPVSLKFVVQSTCSFSI